MTKLVFIHPRLGYMDAQRDRPAPPLGILAAVALLKNTYHITILDQRLFIADKDFYAQLKALLAENPRYIALSVYTGVMITYALEISKYIKENSSIPVVWGGIHPTLLPRQTLENKYIDFIIQGEGELTLPEFSDNLAKRGLDLPAVKGVWAKKHGSIVYGGERPFLDLKLLPPIPYELIDLKNYIQSYAGKKYIYYQASRGCTNRCTYCYNQAFNRGIFRAQPLDKVLDEISSLQKKYSFQGIYFVDDNIFLIGKEQIFRLAKKMQQLGLSWAVQGSDIVSLTKYTSADFKYLESCGLTRLAIGVESASKKIRKLIAKTGALQQIRQTVAELRDTKIHVWCNYVINFPGETVADLRESIALIFELQKINKNVRNSPFFMYTPFPGTPLFEKCTDFFPTPGSLEEWGKLGWESMHANIFADYLKDQRLFQSLFLVSLLDDYKVSDISTNKILIFLARLYRPIARFRLKHLFFCCNIELWVFKRLFPVIFNV